jgi:CRP-like cAMP-binding protein
MIEVKRPGAGAKPEAGSAHPGLGGTVVSFHENDRVFSQGTPADAVFYVRSGRVKLTVVSRTGKEAILGVASEGQFLGESCLAGARVRLKSAIAMTDCELVRIDREVMESALQRDHALADVFVERMLARNIRYEADLVDQLLNSSEKRLARALLLLARVSTEATPEAIDLKISQEALAEMVGTTRPRVNAFMNKFRTLGYIDYGNDGLHVHRSLLQVVLQ